MILWPLAALLALMAVVGFMVASKLSKWANPKMPPMPQPTRTGKKQAYSADQPEVVIIGAGVVGGTMAIQFAKQGRHVTVIERQMEAPDRIVGEFLQPGGYKKMVELGIDDCVEGIDAVTYTGYVVYRSKDVSVDLPFPANPAGGFYTGRGFHNDRLLMKLREKAKSFPTVRFVEGTVTDLIEEGERIVGVHYTLGEGESATKHSLKAPLTLVADGCFSKFRNKTNAPNHPKTISSSFVGVVVPDVTLPHEGCGHVMLTEPTPMLFYRISSTEVRALVDVPNDAPGTKMEYIRSQIVPQLPPKLGTALDSAMNIPNNFKTMPNFKLHPAPVLRKGMITIGDALNIRHPLTGGGMTVAFSDMSRLSPLLAEVEDFARQDDVLAAYRYFFASRKPLASTINILAQALYRVFGQCANEAAVSTAIRQACFAYFELGGICVTGPMSLLSGVIESPWTLLFHYARVGIYGAYIFALRPVLAIKILIAVFKVFYPLMTAELDAHITPYNP
jgi:squalene monooxygenase